jgi:hypothetical protein
MGANPRVEQLKVLQSHKLENIILGWKVMPGTNTLAYFEHL